MILLDDVESTAALPTSRLYRNPSQYWAAKEITEIASCLAAIESATQQGLYVVAAFAYELGHYLQGMPLRDDQTPTSTAIITDNPLIEVWVFPTVNKLSKAEVDQWLFAELAQLPADEAKAGVANLSESLSADSFEADIVRIQAWIKSGDTYQINHTYQVRGESYGAPLALYARLRGRQPGRYGAFVAAHSHYILSHSPELFVQRTGQQIAAMPMKGTANALDSSTTALSSDPKNRAENVMIVDLLRNDLGRIAVTGSVTVPALFEVARHGDVLQMTSTVTAQLQPEIQLQQILAAIFPCGSITGAPKKRSMEIIRTLEPQARNYYCGALGWFDPNQDFALSVPIRTIQLSRDTQTQASHFVMGVGAGITNDSNPAAEWQECQVKSGFLSHLPSSVGLFETIRVSGGQALQIAAHYARLAKSAQSLGISILPAQWHACIEDALQQIPAQGDFRLRIDLSPTGLMSFQFGALEALPAVVKIFWAHELLDDPAKAIMHSGNLLLQHKTTQRLAYDTAWQAAVQQGGFDALFTNEQGMVTEGGRSTLFIRPKESQQWLTPPLTAGLLPGIMRQQLLADKQRKTHEVNLSVAEVLAAEEIMICNALRGPLSAYF